MDLYEVFFYLSWLATVVEEAPVYPNWRQATLAASNEKGEENIYPQTLPHSLMYNWRRPLVNNGEASLFLHNLIVPTDWPVSEAANN